MNKLIKTLFGSLAFIAFAQCGSSQALVSEAPFTLDNPVLEPWTAGENDQFSGVNILLPVRSGRAYILDTVYYGYHKAALQKIQKDDYLVYKATIDTTSEPYDIIMHADPREEVGNRPPPVNKNPFELKDDEVVVSYSDKGKRKYFKVTGLPRSSAIHYRERPDLKNRP